MLERQREETVRCAEEERDSAKAETAKEVEQWTAICQQASDAVEAKGAEAEASEVRRAEESARAEVAESLLEDAAKKAAAAAGTIESLQADNAKLAADLRQAILGTIRQAQAAHTITSSATLRAGSPKQRTSSM